MKTVSALLFSALAATGYAHTIFQKVSVNGVDQGELVGVRAPSTNNPTYDVTTSAISCNSNLNQPVSSAVINIPAGAKVGAWWEHVIGGPQGANDPDNPIASSHKGPVQVYLAKVSNAGTADPTGLTWFKISSDGLTNGQWGVDNMIAGGGWNYFTIPSCLASGNYLMRVEIIALHNAYSSKGAQFYMSCANINIQNGGSYTPTSGILLPGGYSQSDPGILLNIYGPSGAPDNGGKPYTPPGPAVITCPAGGSSPPPTTTTTTAAATTTTKSVAPTTLTTSSKPATSTTPSSGSGAPLYGQCGGTGWTGPTTCASGKCVASSAYYSQCLPS